MNQSTPLAPGSCQGFGRTHPIAPLFPVSALCPVPPHRPLPIAYCPIPYTRPMSVLVLALVAVGFVVALPAAWTALRLGRRLGALDTEPIEGQTKLQRRAIPNTGGVAIFLGVALPILAALAAVWTGLAAKFAESVPVLAPLADHLPGIRAETPLALTLVACLLALHVMGLIDDRRPLGAWPKLAVMLAPALVIVLASDTRLLELLDTRVGGTWASILVTVLWFLIVTNAMNFMDNMDGISAGAGAVACACFLVAAATNGQWFVAAVLALLLGALAGFLVFNVPPAKLFMGDAGSLVLGFLLAFLTVRTTYYGGERSGAWYGVLMPLVVLAVPLYDFASVTLIRLAQGRSPFVGDLQHFSHRLVRRGLSNRHAMLVVWALTGVTGIGGIALARVEPWQAVLIGVQTVLILLTIALLERASTPGNGA